MIQRNDWSLQRKGIIDQERHKERVREAIRQNLGSIVSNEAIILSDGKKTVKVPIRSLEEYKFRFDHRKRRHVGQGDGNTQVGDVIAREGQGGPGAGSGQAGGEGGSEYYEAEVDIDEIAALIFEDLQLPFLEDKAKRAVPSKTTRFTEIRRTGVMANLDKRRMILENIRRNARERGVPRFGNVKKEDLRFKTWEEEQRYESNAVVIAMMDVSGCLTAGHLIEMADGSCKDICEIEVGDEVACIDLGNHEKVASVVTKTFTKRVARTFIIETEDTTLRATPAHVFFVYDEPRDRITEKRTDELVEGDALLLADAWRRRAKRGKPTIAAIGNDLSYTPFSYDEAAIGFYEQIGSGRAGKDKKLEGLVSRRSDASVAARSESFVLFDWWERFAPLRCSTRTCGDQRMSAFAWPFAERQTVARDPGIAVGALRAVRDAMGDRAIVSRVKKIELCEEPVQVYDCEVARHHNYIVDGILSHNSMGEFKKYIARSFYFWMVRFLRTKYDNVDIVFISHHTEAREVTEEQFFTQGESGGTVVSSAYRLALDIIKERYSPRDWNIYPFHFSDGDNYYSDNEEAVRLADELIETCNLFGYGEIGEEGAAGYRRSSGALLSIFNDRLKNKEHFIGVRIDEKEDVYPALRQFFGRRGMEI